MATNKKNPRKVKLEKIMTKIATFIVEETYTDELEIQKDLSDAIKCLEKAADKCVESDEKNAQSEA